MYDFKRNQIVDILDRPFGHPTKDTGKIVGIPRRDTYAVLVLTGLNEGCVKQFKYYSLRERRESNDKQEPFRI